MYQNIYKTIIGSNNNNNNNKDNAVFVTWSIKEDIFWHYSATDPLHHSPVKF